MRAGTLREKIIAQRQSGRDGWGESTAWNNVGTFYASVLPTQSAEGTAAEGVETIVKFTIKVRYGSAAAALTTKDRIIWRGQTIDIVGITPNERRTELQIDGVFHA